MDSTGFSLVLGGLYWVQSGVLPKKFGHKLFLSLSAQLDNV